MPVAAVESTHLSVLAMDQYHRDETCSQRQDQRGERFLVKLYGLGRENFLEVLYDGFPDEIHDHFRYLVGGDLVEVVQLRR